MSPKGITINDISNIVTISFERKKLSVYNESNNSFLSPVSFSIIVLVIKTNTKREKMCLTEWLQLIFSYCKDKNHSKISSLLIPLMLFLLEFW